MVDTITLKTSLLVRPEIVRALESPEFKERNWTSTAIRQVSAKGWRSETMRLSHQPSGATLWLAGEIISSVQVSLPRLVFGTNGCLITDEMQLQGARAKLWDLVGEIAHLSEAAPAELTRLDLVLHLPTPPARLLPVLRFATSPYIRRKTHVYNSTSVVYPGSMLRVTAYDKAAEMKLGPGHLTRLEVSLRKSRSIQRHLGHRDFNNLRFDECYAAYREIVLAFDLPPEPAKKYSEPGLIAACEDQEFRPTGIAVTDWALQEKNPRTHRRLQREIAKKLCGMRRIDFGALLPENGPLPACLEPVLPNILS